MDGCDDCAPDLEVQSVLGNDLLIGDREDRTSNRSDHESDESLTCNDEAGAEFLPENATYSLGHDISKSAFLPYRPTTILTNLQRGNVKSETAPSSPELNLYQLVAQGEIFPSDVEEQVNDPDDSGLTLLMWASAYGQVKTVDILLECGANVNNEGNGKETALHLASCYGHVDIVKKLIACGAKVDHIDESGSTALMYAAYNNHAGCVNLLLLAAADVTLENELWQTALSIAVERNSRHAQTVLEKHIIRLLEM